MKKRKPYYIVIAILCFSSLISIFLPYLTFPDNLINKDGYLIDLRQAALDSNIISEIATENNLDEANVYRIGQNVLRGREPKEEDAWIFNMVASAIDQKVSVLQEVEIFQETNYTFFRLINLSTSVITYLSQNIISAILIILCMVATVVLLVVSGVLALIRSGQKTYRFIRIASIVSLGLTFLGLVSINQISVGALQIKPFVMGYWGNALIILIPISLIVWLIATIGAIHEKWEGFITWKIILRQRQLFFMTIPFIIFALIFYYAPLVGWFTAFQNFKPSLTLEQQAWVGWGKFEFLFSNREFLNVIRNTIAMSVLNLALGFAFSIGFALLLNEVRFIHSKKFVQTVSYLPHFLSWVIVTGIVNDVLSMETGIVNQVLVNIGAVNRPINFFANPSYFWWIVGFTNVWKGTGWGSIIYLSAITAISPDLYEAASIDGAGRFKKMKHITMPGIKPTVFILLIINIGNILNAGFEVQYLLGNGLVQSVSQTIDIYVLRYGISLFDFSLGTAAGIFKSLVSVVLIFIANRFAKAAGEERLF